MFDQTLFNSICSVKCTDEELKNFVSKIDKKEFDLNNAFEKYYSLERILHAIDKYKTQQIDDIFLANWANAYNWIIMSGFKISSQNKKNGVKEIVVDEISEWLDALSFFETDNEDCFEMERYTAVFSTLDRVYKNANEWAVKCVHDDYDSETKRILLFNANSKAYLEIQRDCYDDYAVDGQLLKDKDAFDKALKDLKESGYIEMPYAGEME